MDKKLAAVLVVAGVLIFALGMNYFLDAARQSAEDELRAKNPLFHTVPEGGECRSGEGDCQAGLTCVNSTCERY